MTAFHSDSGHGVIDGSHQLLEPAGIPEDVEGKDYVEELVVLLVARRNPMDKCPVGLMLSSLHQPQQVPVISPLAVPAITPIGTKHHTVSLRETGRPSRSCEFKLKSS